MRQVLSDEFVDGLGVFLSLDLGVRVVPQAEEVHQVVEVLVPHPVRVVVDVQEKPGVFCGYALGYGSQVFVVIMFT